MFNALLTAFLPLIIRVVLVVLGFIIIALVPKAIGYIKTKVGAAKFSQGLAVAEKVYAQIVTYIQTNPAAAKTLEALYAQFRAGMLLVLPLNDAELDFLFKTILADLIKAIGANPVDYAGAFLTAPTNIKAKLLFK